MEPSSFDTVDLHAWVTQLRAGDTTAAEPIFKKIITRVEMLTIHSFHRFPRVGRFVDADDVLQNMMIRLLRAMKEVRPESTKHFYALTSELIRRELIDLTRHFYGPRGSGTHELPAMADEDGASYTTEAPSHDEPEQLEWHHRFHEALEELPVEEREVIGLSYYHGWSTAQIAELFQVSERTIQRRANTAAEKLRALVTG